MLSSRVSVLSGSRSLLPRVDCIIWWQPHIQARETGSKKGGSWSGLWEQLREQNVSAWTRMLPSGNKLINCSLERVCRGGPLLLLKSYIISFFYISPIIKRSKGLEGSADLLRNLLWLCDFVLCCKCCLQNSVHRDRVCSHLTPQQNFPILWELACSEESSSYPECLWVPLSTVSQLLFWQTTPTGISDFELLSEVPMPASF